MMVVLRFLIQITFGFEFLLSFGSFLHRNHRIIPSHAYINKQPKTATFFKQPKTAKFFTESEGGELLCKICGVFIPDPSFWSLHPHPFFIRIIQLNPSVGGSYFQKYRLRFCLSSRHLLLFALGFPAT